MTAEQHTPTRIDRHHRWHRGDGTVLSCIDLNEAVPMMLDELEDIAHLVGLVEEWLLLDEIAADQLTEWLNETNHRHGKAQHITEALGTLDHKLLRIVRAGTPDTGHTHPTTA